MDRKRLELITAGILILIFVIAMAGSFKKIRLRQAASASAIQAVPVQGQAMQETIFSPKKKEAKRRIADSKLTWGRDPFTLGETKEAVGDTVASLKIMGMTTGANKKPKAIINNEMVGVGAMIGKFKVLKIEKDKVLVTDGKESYELLLNVQ